MAEILLIRHAQSEANKRNFTAFGNVDSPLTEKGVEQAVELRTILPERYGITPADYDRPIAVSEYTRAQQTAQIAGFTRQHIRPIINESDVDREITSGIDVIAKHRDENWAPESTRERAGKLIDSVCNGELDYEIFFTHGMFMASVLLECKVRQIDADFPFDEVRGFVPLQTGIVKLEL